MSHARVTTTGGGGSTFTRAGSVLAITVEGAGERAFWSRPRVTAGRYDERGNELLQAA